MIHISYFDINVLLKNYEQLLKYIMVNLGNPHYESQIHRQVQRVSPQKYATLRITKLHEIIVHIYPMMRTLNI